MMRFLILLSSTAAVAIGLLYEETGGLIIGVDQAGVKILASDYYLSSGGDDSLLLGLGFMAFGVALAAAVLACAGLVGQRVLKIVYGLNYLLLLLILLLVNLDVSIVSSILLGDFYLLGGLLLTTLPLFFAGRPEGRSDPQEEKR